MADSPDSDQYQIVADLLARQDDVLEQLEQLNTRVEAAIVEVNSVRNIESDADVHQQDTSADAGQKRAA